MGIIRWFCNGLVTAVPVAAKRGVGPFFVICLTIAKLFPPQYKCETRACSQLVHNAVMTLCCFLFDLWVAINAYKIRKDQNLINSYSPTDRLPSKVWIWIKKLSKVGNLLSSAAWICYDVVVGVSSAPGKSTMALGILTGAASFIFLIADSPGA